MLVGEPPPAFRSVKLAILPLGILDVFARQTFVHWVARTDADSSAEATPPGKLQSLCISSNSVDDPPCVGIEENSTFLMLITKHDDG